jgi:hypothetical protein
MLSVTFRNIVESVTNCNIGMLRCYFGVFRYVESLMLEFFGMLKVLSIYQTIYGYLHSPNRAYFGCYGLLWWFGYFVRLIALNLASLPLFTCFDVSVEVSIKGAYLAVLGLVIVLYCWGLRVDFISYFLGMLVRCYFSECLR